MDLFSFITGDEIRDVKIFLSCIIGIPIPLIALFFLKSNIDYLKPSNTKDDEPKIVNIENQKDDKNEKTDETPSAIHVEKLPTSLEEVAHGDQSMDDHVVINPVVVEEQLIDEEQEREISEEQEQLDEQGTSHSQHSRVRHLKPMISQRRNKSVSILHRG